MHDVAAVCTQRNHDTYAAVHIFEVIKAILSSGHSDSRVGKEYTLPLASTHAARTHVMRHAKDNCM